MKKIIRILLLMIVFAFVLTIGNTTIKKFGFDIGFKDPFTTLKPTLEKGLNEAGKIVEKTLKDNDVKIEAPKVETSNTTSNTASTKEVKLLDISFQRLEVKTPSLEEIIKNDYVTKVDTSSLDKTVYEKLFNSSTPDKQVYLYTEKPTVTYVKLNKTSVERQKGNAQQFLEDPYGWPRKNVKKQIGTYNGWFWNRSHLIADQLGGPSNALNSVPGTRTQNVGNNSGGMRVPESRAFKYVSETGKELLYFVDVVYYDEANKIPNEVRVTLYNEEIFEQYITYNVAQGIEINYKTGELK